MSTELKTVNGQHPERDIELLQFAGGAGLGVLMQISTPHSNHLHVEVTKAEALRLAVALVEWANDERDTKYFVTGNKK